MQVLTILALLLVAITMGLSLTHALEWSGKRQLDEVAYKTLQQIYYPGFTMGGFIGEFGSLIVLPVLLYLTPFGISRFWWIATALFLPAAARRQRGDTALWLTACAVLGAINGTVRLLFLYMLRRVKVL